MVSRESRWHGCPEVAEWVLKGYPRSLASPWPFSLTHVSDFPSPGQV